MVHTKPDAPLILLTRPAPESARLLRSLTQHGFQALIDPMLRVEPVFCPPLNLKHVQAVVTTSIHGLQRFAQLTPDHDLPLYVVGEVSESHARQQGFTHVCAAQGSVDHLMALIKKNLNPQSGKLVYLSGQDIKKDLPKLLGQEGYHMEHFVVYRAFAASSLKQETQEALLMGRLKGILFFSSRTVEIFLNLTHMYSKAFRDMIAVCLSKEIAHGLKPYCWKEILLSDERSGRRMVYTLDQYFHPKNKEG